MYGDKIKFDERVVDKIERGFYYSKKKRRWDLDGVRRIGILRYIEDLERLRKRHTANEHDITSDEHQ